MILSWGTCFVIVLTNGDKCVSVFDNQSSAAIESYTVHPDGTQEIIYTKN